MDLDERWYDRELTVTDVERLLTEMAYLKNKRTKDFGKTQYKYGNKGVLRWMMQEGIAFCFTHSFFYLLLKNFDVEFIELFIQWKHFDPSSELWWFPLFGYSLSGQKKLQLVDLLFEKKFLDPNQELTDGRTIFMEVCQRGSYEMVKKFLDQGADPKIKDDWKRDSLFYAQPRSDPRIGSLIASLCY